jgi:hypothetical protein
MKPLKKFCFFYLQLVLILGCWAGSGSSKADKTVIDEKDYYGIEINGVLCGYNESAVNTIEQDGKLLYIPKKSNPTEPLDDVPDKFKPYLGEYYFAPENLNLKVFYENGTLAIDDPNEKEKIKLYPTEEENKWIDQYNKNTISFEFDDTGNAKAMKADVVDKFNRI